MLDCFADYALACARHLPSLPEGHPCRRLHGHTFDVRLTITGPLDPVHHWVMDFGDLDALWQARVHAVLDHRVLNDIPGLEHPTSERLAVWLWETLAPQLPLLAAIEVRESGRSGVVYRGTSSRSGIAGGNRSVNVAP